jgi:hypothetical protein
MIGTKRSWTGRAALAAMAVGLVWATSGAIAAPAIEVVDAGVAVPSANSLLRFYPSQLSSTPAGVIEDKEVWLAKVQGLMAGSPSLLQQSLLMSQSKQEFSGNVRLLQQLQKGSLDEGAAAVKALAKDKTLGAKGLDVGPDSPLGSGNGDLVYTALAPCRIMDTRNAAGASGVQGPLVGNTLYQLPGYITAGSNWSLYGQTAPLSDCGLNSNVGTFIWAIAIVITIPAEGGRPNFDAYLGVSDSSTLSTVLSKVALNFTHGQGISTLYIVPQVAANTIYFAMPAGLSANVIFDVVGFFAVSEATALECNENASAATVIGAGATGSAISPACASGFTQTGGGCEAAFAGLYMDTNERNNATSWFCASTNTTGGSINLISRNRCCRVPGR